MARIVMNIVNDNGGSRPLSGRGRAAFLEVDLDLMTKDVIVINAIPAIGGDEELNYLPPKERIRFAVSPELPRQSVLAICQVGNLDQYLRAIWDGLGHEYPSGETIFNDLARNAGAKVQGFLDRISTQVH